jgi:phosphoribosyl 1,2-cyclic phosphodiesterase/CheY-like chemotaxis protein
MADRLRFYVVDDDEFVGSVIGEFLTEAGHEVTRSRDSVAALQAILRAPPDCVIADIMMPKLDGLQICRELRAQPALAATKIIMLSSKSFDYDRRRAYELGADAYLTKPVERDELLARVREVVDDKIELRFWGVRGTLPVPGPRAVRYGGNTSCVTLRFPRDDLFIFDAGTGIKELARHFGPKPPRLRANIMISHPHWDHINALPFFTPLYVPGNAFTIYGAAHGGVGMRELISAQMDGVYFPVTIREFGAHVEFRDLHEEALEIDGIKVDTMLLSHPGTCLGYRLRYRNRTICYVTDNELFLPETPHYDAHYFDRLVGFVQGADVLITDTTYMDDEYPSRVGWGHSPVGQVVNLAHNAAVKQLHLFHHDPDQTDDDIDRKLDAVRALLASRGSATVCVAPTEGTRVAI